MASWWIFKNPLGLYGIKVFNFPDISKVFTNIMKVIYSDIKSEAIVSTPFAKLSINIVQA